MIDLECVPFDVVYVFDDIKDICCGWEKMYTNVLNDHAPIKSRNIRTAPGQSKFITLEIRKEMWKRNARKRKYYKTRSSEDWEVYRIQRNRVVSMRRKSAVNYFDYLCVSCAGNPREFWRAVRPLCMPRKVHWNNV